MWFMHLNILKSFSHLKGLLMHGEESSLKMTKIHVYGNWNSWATTIARKLTDIFRLGELNKMVCIKEVYEDQGWDDTA